MSRRRYTKADEQLKAASHAAVGGAIGYGTVAATGMSAIGIVGTGAGIGAAAGPVGIAVGIVGGLAIYGLRKAFKG